MSERAQWSWRGALMAAALMTLAISSPIRAHHSFAMFDMQKQVEVQGTLKAFHWTNPHSWLVLTVRDSAGNSTDVNIESHPPGALLGMGWKRDDLKSGDFLKVTLFPMRDGSPGGSLVKVVLADRRELWAIPQIPGSKAPPPPGDTQ